MSNIQVSLQCLGGKTSKYGKSIDLNVQKGSRKKCKFEWYYYNNYKTAHLERNYWFWDSVKVITTIYTRRRTLFLSYHTIKETSQLELSLNPKQAEKLKLQKVQSWRMYLFLRFWTGLLNWIKLIFLGYSCNNTGPLSFHRMVITRMSKPALWTSVDWVGRPWFIMSPDIPD